MIDGNQADDKILSVLESDVAYGHFQDISDCPAGLLERLQHYFLSYKQRPGDPGHRVQIAEVYDKAEALAVIERSMSDYQNKFGNPEEHLRRFLNKSEA
jgi:inorganic pyrophosphatase